jgi:polyphosphate kinase 2 (PPK2 family)
MKDIAAQKVAIAERLKTYEKMKIPGGEKEKTTQISKEEAAQQIKENRRNQDEKDANAGLVVFIHGEDGGARIKGGTVDKLVERLIDGTAYGKISINVVNIL